MDLLLALTIADNNSLNTKQNTMDQRSSEIVNIRMGFDVQDIEKVADILNEQSITLGTEGSRVAGYSLDVPRVSEKESISLIQNSHSYRTGDLLVFLGCANSDEKYPEWLEWREVCFKLRQITGELDF